MFKICAPIFAYLGQMYRPRVETARCGSQEVVSVVRSGAGALDSSGPDCCLASARLCCPLQQQVA